MQTMIEFIDFNDQAKFISCNVLFCLNYLLVYSSSNEVSACLCFLPLWGHISGDYLPHQIVHLREPHFTQKHSYTHGVKGHYEDDSWKKWSPFYCGTKGNYRNESRDILLVWNIFFKNICIHTVYLFINFQLPTEKSKRISLVNLLCMLLLAKQDIKHQIKLWLLCILQVQWSVG